MTFDFKLAIYNPEGEPRHIAVSEYLLKHEKGALSWKPSPDDATFLLTIDDTRYIAPDWNLGRCEWLLPQMEAAADRLRNNSMALIRSAVIEGSEVPYISFEPSNNDILISLFIIPDENFERIFPAGPFSEKRDELYNYFQKHREELLNRIDDPYLKEIVGTEYFSALRVPKEQMIKSLSKEINAGQELFKILNPN